MRRSAPFLPLLLLLTSSTWGCGAFAGSDAPTPTPTVTVTATPTRTPTPSPTPTPLPHLDSTAIGLNQGSSVVLRALGGGATASATFNGRTYPMLKYSGGFWTVLGVAADASLGSYPVDVTVRDEAGAPVATLSATVTVDDGGYPVESVFLPPGPSQLLDPNLSAQEAATRSQIYANSTREKLWAGPFALPVNAPITSVFGVARSYNGGPVGSPHSGTDFGVDEGTPIAAANSGTVVFAGPLPIRGNSVIIDHGAGVFSAYHHLSSATVGVGQRVNKGDLIAYSGATGLATGPHLHWEIVVNGVNVDPMLWTYEDIAP